MTLRQGQWNRGLVALNVTIVGLLVLELLIGDTILANLLLIALAMFLTFCTVVAGAIEVVRQRSVHSVLTLIFSLVLLGYLILRVALDSVPAGYGP